MSSIIDAIREYQKEYETITYRDKMTTILNTFLPDAEDELVHKIVDVIIEELHLE